MNKELEHFHRQKINIAVFSQTGMLYAIPMQNNDMNAELRMWLSVTRRLPAIRGAGRLSGIAECIYNRKPREDVTVKVRDFTMRLDPAETLGRELLFCPQICDRHELSYLRTHLRPGDTFVDCGANVGFYSLAAAKLVGSTGTVLAIEASPVNSARLAENVKLNDMTHVKVANVGLSDKSETLRLGLNTTGNSGGHSFINNSAEGISVQCKTLADVLLSEGVKGVHGMKMDIEGFEAKVLKEFFRGNANLWPKFLIIEVNPNFGTSAKEELLSLLTGNHYRLTRISELNYVAEM